MDESLTKTGATTTERDHQTLWALLAVGALFVLALFVGMTIYAAIYGKSSHVYLLTALSACAGVVFGMILTGPRLFNK